jgi:putative MFS transporter
MAYGLGLCFTITGILLIDKFGRKPLFALGQLCSAIPLLLLWLYAAPGQSLIFLSAMFMLGSAFNSILALGLSTYTAELYPTEMRAIGVGVGNAWVRFAAIIGPIFLGWASANIGLNNAYFIYACFGVIGGLTVIFIAIETKGKVLEILSPSLSARTAAE